MDKFKYHNITGHGSMVFYGITGVIKEFAERIGMANNYLSEIESGNVKPGFEFFYKASKAFNINTFYLLHDVGIPAKEERYDKKAARQVKQVSLDKFRHEYSRVHEEIDEFLFYFIKSAYFRFKIMA